MADVEIPREAATILEGISRGVRECEAVAEALVETGEPWVQDELWRSLLLPTDYERARRRLIRQHAVLRRKLRAIRRQALSPEAIRGGHFASEILKCCRACPAANRKRLACGQPFRCLVRANLDSEERGRFRFRLNARGQILESR